MGVGILRDKMFFALFSCFSLHCYRSNELGTFATEMSKHLGYKTPNLLNFQDYYCICHIFHESNFSRIGTSRHFREWLNSRSRRRAMDGEFTYLHFARALCTVQSVLLVLHTQVAFLGLHSCVGIGGKFFACC